MKYLRNVEELPKDTLCGTTILKDLGPINIKNRYFVEVAAE